MLLLPASITLEIRGFVLLESALVCFVLGAGILSPPQSGVSLGVPTCRRRSRACHRIRASQCIGAIWFRRISTFRCWPCCAILLGDDDPDNDRLRYVWILTSTRPTPWQRAASALSFGYFRAGSKRHAGRVPSPGARSRRTQPKRLRQSLQRRPAGPGIRSAGNAAIRSTTRTYRTNSSDYTKLQVFQALGTLDNLALDNRALNRGSIR